MDIRVASQDGAEQKIVGRGVIGKELVASAVGVIAGAAVGGAVLPFGAAPFGFGLLCAADKYALAVYLGVCAGALATPHPFVIFIAYTLCLLLRIAVSLGRKNQNGQAPTLGTLSEWAFGEHISLRVVTASLGAFGVGLYRLFSSGFLYYDLFGALITLLLASVSALVWYWLPRSLESKMLFMRAVAIISLIAAAVWGARGLDVYGVSASAFLCMVSALWFTKRKGVMFGCFCALAAGLCVAVDYAPLFVFGALCYGFISTVSPLLACFSSLGIGMAWGIYIDGIGALSSLFPALLAANFLYFTADKLFLQKAPASEEIKEVETQEQGNTGADMVAIIRLDDAARRIKLLCEGFSSLSRSLLQTAEADKTDADVSKLISKAWSDANGLTAHIGELGESQCVDVPWYYGESMADALRTESLALDMRALSEYLSGVMVENQSRYTVDVELGKRVSAELERAYGLVGVSVCAFGDGAKRVTLVSESSDIFQKNLDAICETVGRVCGMPMRAGEIGEFEGKRYVTLTRDAILEAVFAGRKRNSLGEKDFCGDSFGLARAQDEGKLVAFISDGMGSGHDAAITSGTCALFLQKLLPVNMSVGNCVESTLEVLNGFLCTRNGTGRAECSATVDLGIFDLVNCRASFYKSGAAPTYVFRDGALFKLRSRTIPMGIVKDPDIGKIELELLPGDVVVMVSDGVTEGREECPELFEYLRSRLLTHDAEQLADALIKYADERGCTDDVTALVVKISENIPYRIGV